MTENNPTASLIYETKRARSFGEDLPRSASENSRDEILRLYAVLDLVNERTHPRTAQLLSSGLPKMAQKMMEEAGEVAIEPLRHRGRAVVRESADLLYNLVVLWRECSIAPDDVWAEMNLRANTLGIAEKMPKRSKSRFEP
jgi:phosphoribosyl-ATP pyrophosphohydrolase